jgi:hypothetical protein
MCDFPVLSFRSCYSYCAGASAALRLYSTLHFRALSFRVITSSLYCAELVALITFLFTVLFTVRNIYHVCFHFAFHPAENLIVAVFI